MVILEELGNVYLMSFKIGSGIFLSYLRAYFTRCQVGDSLCRLILQCFYLLFGFYPCWWFLKSTDFALFSWGIDFGEPMR